MTVFRYYFKLVKSFLPVILMYTVIFTLFGVVATTTGKTTSQFEMSEVKFIVHNMDTESRYTKAFIDYLKEYGTLIKVKNEEDALFYREVDSILTIPKGFGDSILNSNPLELSRKSVPDSANVAYFDLLINRYLQLSETYVKSGFTEEEILTIIDDDMKLHTKTSLIHKEQDDLIAPAAFYNFSNYTILAICIFVVGITMNIFYHSNIKKRNFASPISHRKINIQLLLGNSILVFLVWLLYVCISIVLYGMTMFTQQGILLIINAFLFSTVALALGFFIGILVKDKEAQNGIVNVLALGSSFICGAFVPQDFLGSGVLKMAHLLPSYWFIKNNNEIILLSNFTRETLQPILIRMGVLILFTTILFIIANLVSKKTIHKTV